MKARWHQKITLKEFRHIRETASGSLAQFKRNREWHRLERDISGEEPCFECRHIALKLGIEKAEE
jgi:hypothetical protein